jgi:hypothetical protein
MRMAIVSLLLAGTASATDVDSAWVLVNRGPATSSWDGVVGVYDLSDRDGMRDYLKTGLPIPSAYPAYVNARTRQGVIRPGSKAELVASARAARRAGRRDALRRPARQYTNTVGKIAELVPTNLASLAVGPAELVKLAGRVGGTNRDRAYRLLGEAWGYAFEMQVRSDAEQDGAPTWLEVLEDE